MSSKDGGHQERSTRALSLRNADGAAARCPGRSPGSVEVVRAGRVPERREGWTNEASASVSVETPGRHVDTLSVCKYFNLRRKTTIKQGGMETLINFWSD